MCAKGGAVNGFAKIHILKGCDLRFSLLLTWIEIFSYLGMTGVGALCLYQTRKLYGEDPYEHKD